MPRDASFIQQFISDFWDLLPKEDKELFAAYWHSLTMIAADLYQETFEAALSIAVENAPLYHVQRWNSYQLNEDTADLQQKADSIALTGITESSLSEDAILFDTLAVARPSGYIKFTESKRLYEETPVELTYGNLVADTIRVAEGSAIFIPNRDYSVNRVDGLISRIEHGGIPSGTLVAITYTHPAYREGVDYTLDRVTRKVARIETGNISNGEIVAVNYTYDNKVADKLSGRCTIDSIRSTIEDTASDYTGVLTHRTVEILSGESAGTYTVKEVLSATKIEVNETFETNETLIPYTINAFPYAISADTNIVSIPTMQDLIVDKTLLYQEGIDYIVGSGKVSFKAVPPIIRTNDGPTLWAEETHVDEQTIYRNFGKLVDLYRASSESYLKAVRSLWYTYWTGPTHENLLRGLHVLIGLPYATEPGTVTSITTEETLSQDVSADADLMPVPVRIMPTHGSDAITSPDTIVFYAATTGDTAFRTEDIGRQIRIQGSVSNDGYYTIVASPASNTAQVSPATLTTEGAGFTGRIYETGPVSVFEYSGTFFTQEDVGRILRISGSSAGNDGDHMITSIRDSSSCVIEGAFVATEGPGSITANVYNSVDLTIDVTNENGIATTFDVPSGLSSRVSVDDTVEKLERLTTGVRIYDSVNSPGFVANMLGLPGIQRFLTQNADAADQLKALELLESHLWIPQVLTSASSAAVNIDEIRTFLTNMKPKWSEYVFAFADDFEDTIDFGETSDALDIALMIDLTTRVVNAWQNTHQVNQFQYTGSGDIALETNRSSVVSREIKYPNIFYALDDTVGDFTEADEGRYLVISGSGSGNDGVYPIRKVLSSSEVQVGSDFAASEVGGFTSTISACLKLTDASAAFTTTTSRGDLVRIGDGSNIGIYKVNEVVDDNNLIINETVLNAPFSAVESGRAFSIISYTYFMNQDAINWADGFIHERTDGRTLNATTFKVDDSVNLWNLNVRSGYFLVVKSGANIDRYDIVNIPTANEVTISGAFASSPTFPEDYAICQAALVRSDSVPATLEVIPI